jgi:hypothetical protein
MANRSSQPLLWPALLVGLTGLLWLASDLKWVPIDLPLGPLSVLIIALALILYAYDQ